jgi:hypothetical protein
VADIVAFDVDVIRWLKRRERRRDKFVNIPNLTEAPNEGRGCT